MSLPRTNLTNSTYTPWVNEADAAVSFVTAIPVLHDSAASVEVIYSGLDDVDGTVKLTGSNSGDYTRSRDLTYDVVTMTTANSSILFNVNQIGYGYIHLIYDAGGNTAGTITAHLVRKQTS